MRNKSNKYRNKRHNNITKKIKNRNSKDINDISIIIYNNTLNNGSKNDILESYTPSVNKNLVALMSIERDDIYDCNLTNAYKLKEPLKINIKGGLCVPYYDLKAVKVLLKNLSANKHINPDKIITPMQIQANCWFNTMFMTLFVSDKGRKFFHFFRQLMIEGVQSDGKKIPNNIKDGFALLNYAIELCLTGNKYAYKLDTNIIIKNIYDSIPQIYKDKLPYIKNIDEAGNPINYYKSLISYLNNTSLEMLYVKNINNEWKSLVIFELKLLKSLPHFIILEVYDGKNGDAGISGLVNNKPNSFVINGGKYMLDSCVIRDTSQQHFCAVLTCENKEMAYDGMSYHRLEPLSWKKYINSNFTWEFEGSKDVDGTPLRWNFKHGYQLLLYYRVR
jgi:hypothetical protein